MEDPEDSLAQLLSRQHGHEPVLGEKEQQVLDLIAQEEEMRLERALLEAQAGMRHLPVTLLQDTSFLLADLLLFVVIVARLD
jgi:hypothetical protein